jgi:hypothetical protein
MPTEYAPPVPARPAPTLPPRTQGNVPEIEPEKVEAHEEEEPTISHELANANHEYKGAAQLDHGQTEVKDLGWNDSGGIPQPLVGGLPNEELWTLLRRFNKVRDTGVPETMLIRRSKCIM